ncbi:MAG TPA: ArsA-related P-loop ATPase [Ilumatobacteraceae bacterium]|jgi:arsenite-transporting ATPase|nr:ArsA-related P-loop ATPase [Ilumatobacteraceae bacterium]
MVSLDWLTSTRVAIVAGKGGVGSSTVAAAYALAAAREGADVLFVAVDGRPGMGPLLGGRELDSTDRILRRIKGAGQVRGRTIPADQAFGDYLELKGVGGMLRRAASAASLPMIAAATPGLEHLLVLGKIKELERERAADLIIVDAPPAGHAAPFLRSATGLSDVVQSGPVREQSVEVDAMLRDPARCLAMIVTLPEETPVTEALELGEELRSDIGLSLLPAVVNSCWPDRPGLAKTPAMAARSQKIQLSASAKSALASSTDFGRDRLERQRQQIERLAIGIGVPLVTLPRLATPRLTLHQLGELADALVAPRIGGAS